MNQIKTKHHWHPNTSVEFTATGMWMRLSLNIPPDIGQYLSPNNVVKGKQYWVYGLKCFVQSDMVNKDNLEQIHKMLLSNCMTNIRRAKEKKEELCKSTTTNQ